jgi:ferredoxin
MPLSPAGVAIRDNERPCAPQLLRPMSTRYTVACDLNGTRHSFSCRDDQTVLAAAEAAGVELPSSCCSGVCTTCAARLLEGSVHQPDAMGVKAELQQQGYALLCVAYPRSDLTLLAAQEDALYEAQFGQYQK